MLSREDLSAISHANSAAMEQAKAYIDRKVEECRLDEAKIVSVVLAHMPTPKDAEPVDVDKVVDAVLAKMPEPQPGKDAEPVDESKIIASVLAQIPKPQDGKDAEPVDVDKVVADVLAKVPTPKNGEPGKDAVVDENKLVNAVLEQIPAPKDGEDGRDALQIEVLPRPNFAKSYPRGTYARHEGGIIRSFRDTDEGEGDIHGLGWEVAVAGVKDISVGIDDDCRTIRVKTTLTGKTEQVTAFQIPALIYRGIYSGANSYDKGDVVTWGGSAWHCNEADTKTSPQERTAAWTLMVKQGKPGKDANV